MSIAEILELSGNAARDNRRTRVIPRHVLLAVATDEELSKVKKKCKEKTKLHNICLNSFIVTSWLCNSSRWRSSVPSFVPPPEKYW